ncbi:MAG: sigma-54-dependent transcriptional regulator [Phycisphaerales bacterium]
MPLILVVDDKEMLRDSVGGTLSRAGLEVMSADGLPAAMEAISRRRPDAVVTDLKMPGGSGIDLLRQVREFDEDLPVIVMTAFATVETAVEALKHGAFDYVTKPFEGDEIIIAVKKAVEHARLKRDNAVLRRGGMTPGSPDAGPRGLDRLVGNSAAMRRVKEQVHAVAESVGTALVYGESGTGKEVVARAIHELSPRKHATFLGVNCAALSESLLESELFGHERGAFTGAEKLRKGRFELAEGGTLLLDEISEVSTKIQAKLLRVLQERSFERVGASTPIGVDVRVVATSNVDLPRAVGSGAFRQDLFFRLNVLPIHLPPLRDRLEDVPALAEHFVAGIAQREGRSGLRIDTATLQAMCRYTWPGNVRELQNICERAVVLCKGPVIESSLVLPWLSGPTQSPGDAHANGHHAATFGIASALPRGFAEPKPGAAEDQMLVPVWGRALEDIEREAIVKTLQRFNGHRQRTAHALGIGVRTLGLKLKKWKELSLVQAEL